MGLPTVVAFTDTYLPTVNGVTYTVETWRDRWVRRGGRMDVVYPDSEHTPRTGEHPVSSLPLPVYDGFRLGTPQVPDGLRTTEGDLETADVVHAHTPFSLGIGGLRLSRSLDVPLVASYHTPTAAYAGYLSGRQPIKRLVRETASSYEQWFLERADLVVVPSETTARQLWDSTAGGTPIRVVSNGVDTELFEPTATDEFVQTYGLSADDPIVGYTGRHGHEKRLEVLIEAVSDLCLDVQLVFGGDGPAREGIEARAASAGVDARFLGFLDREELPAFYSLLDVFAFPSPVETEGIVALESMACGTPVAGVEAGALGETVTDGTTGYTAAESSTDAFRDTLATTLAHRDRLAAQCLDRRSDLAVEQSLDCLERLYRTVLQP